jgi:hypothetical protein
MRMEQSLHLLIVDRRRRNALVTWHGSRWLLPIVRMPERVRAGPVLLGWAAEHGITGQIVGQWVGRAAPENDAIDWLAVMDAASERLTAPQNLRWTPLVELRSAASCVDYQRWAAASVLATSKLPATLGPFGTMTWMRDVKTWVDDVVGSLHGSTDDGVPYRTTAYDVVLGLRTARGPVYFKGLSTDRAPEARISAQLAEMAADAFPRTIAVSKRPDGSVWWLIEACPGSPLAAGATCASAARVSAAYAGVQQQTVRAIEEGGFADLAPLDLTPMAIWASDLIDRLDERPHVPFAAVIERSCECVRAARVPHSWIAGDIDPTNVLMHGDEVRFIDLDDSALGPAPIAMATFATRIKRLGISCGSDLYRSYERAWKPQLVMRDLWRDFEIVSTLVDCHLAWKRVVVKTERQEIHGCLGLAQDTLARRLARVVAAHAAA